MNNVKSKEQKLAWKNLPIGLDFFIVEVFRRKNHTDFETMYRIFNIAQPKVVIGPNASYFGILEEDSKSLKLLIETYT